MSSLFNSTETLVFLAIAVAAFLGVGGSFLFGHGDHDLSHEMHGDVDHGVPFFSPQVIFTFLLGFGASGAISSAAGLKLHWSILIGLGSGLLLAGAAATFFSIVYKQQASSLIETSTAIGKIGNVTTQIPANGSGEVGVEVQGQYRTYMARSRDGEIAKGTRVKVVQNEGGQLVVEPERK
jgi:membrane protein implicated in regulation of membrane protease activity